MSSSASIVLAFAGHLVAAEAVDAMYGTLFYYHYFFFHILFYLFYFLQNEDWKEAMKMNQLYYTAGPGKVSAQLRYSRTTIYYNF